MHDEYVIAKATHPVLLIYELRLDQEVWVSRHYHHVLQLGREG